MKLPHGVCEVLRDHVVLESIDRMHLNVYVPQLQRIVEALDRGVKKVHENSAIGVLLYANKDDEVVEWARQSSSPPAILIDAVQSSTRSAAPRARR